MKITTYILITLSVALIIFNITQLDYNNLFNDKNTIAFIGIIASACAILILILFRLATRIKENIK
jgi:hypothetical protein